MNNTVRDIMKLADAYAEKCADVREYLGGNAGIDEADPYWVAMKEAEAALEAAVTALEKDAARSKYMIDTGYLIHEQQFKGGRRYSIGPVFTNYSREWFPTREEAIDAAIRGIQ